MIASDLLLWGGTGQARVLRELVGSSFRIAAIVDRALEDSPLDGVPLLRDESEVDHWLSKRELKPLAAAIAIGGGHGAERRRLASFFRERKISLPTLIHPAAYVAADSVIGEASQVLAGAIVAAGARLGSSVIVNTGAQVDHDSRVGNGAHIGPGAVIAGEVSIGEDVFVGAGAVILPRVSIAAAATIGAGAVVTKDVPLGVTVVGCPARPISNS